MLTILFKNNSEPLYIQIYEHIKNEIVKGNITYGYKLPSKRRLALHLSVSINTVDTAYSQLVAEGYIEPKPKRGYFVCQIDKYLNDNTYTKNNESIAINDNNKILIDFSPRDIDNYLFPFNTFRKIFKTTFDENDLTLLKKPDVQGDINLRKALVNHLYRSRGVKCSENQIIIGAGTSNILQILGFILGRDKNIALENPVYLKAYKIFENMGNKIIPIDIDDKGIQTEFLEGLSNVAIYITPSHHFPLGISMPIDRRIKLLNFASKNSDTYIIEDDYDSEFRYNEKPLPSLQSIDKGEKVIYIGTFSKSIAPSIRISYMVLPESLMKIYLEKCTYMNSNVSTLEQKMITEFIKSGDFERHINKMRKIYKDKRKFLINELYQLGDSISVIGENAGHHLLIKLKTGLSEEDMCKSALSLGVKVYPISQYFIKKINPKYENSVLIGYSALTCKQIKDGVYLIKKAWNL